MLDRIRRKWYEVRWGSEEADKLMQLSGKQLAQRLAILEEHGPILADHFFEQRWDESATRARNKQAAKVFARAIKQNLGANSSANDEVDAATGKVSINYAEIRDKIAPTVEELELITMRETAIEAITCKNETSLQLSSLRCRETELRDLLKHMDLHDSRRRETEKQLENLATVLPELERHYEELEREVEKMKRDVRDKERWIKSRQAATT